MEELKNNIKKLARSQADAEAVIAANRDNQSPEVQAKIIELECEVKKLREELALARRRVEELTELADQDPLIEIMNRRAFVRELSRVMAAVERYDFSASLIYVDLNGLKKINDEKGHAAGDAVLKYLGETFATHVRQTDAVARLGGDEFGIVLTHASTREAQRKMQRMAAIITAKPLKFNGMDIRVSVSWGVFPILKGQDVEEALRAADAAMYSQKKARYSVVT